MKFASHGARGSHEWRIKRAPKRLKNSEIAESEKSCGVALQLPEKACIACETQAVESSAVECEIATFNALKEPSAASSSAQGWAKAEENSAGEYENVIKRVLRAV